MQGTVTMTIDDYDILKHKEKMFESVKQVIDRITDEEKMNGLTASDTAVIYAYTR